MQIILVGKSENNNLYSMKELVITIFFIAFAMIEFQ